MSQNLPTKIAGNNPTFPVLCDFPWYQPSARFLITKMTSPGFNSNSSSLCGGNAANALYLKRKMDQKIINKQNESLIIGDVHDI